MDIRIWGTRGSLAKPGPITLRHGGNTSCVEVRGDDGTLIVLDCGTGPQVTATPHYALPGSSTRTLSCSIGRCRAPTEWRSHADFATRPILR